MLVRLIGFASILGVLAAAAPGTAHAQDCRPGRLMVVLDKSSSMTGTIGGATKWSIATEALDQVAAGYESAIELGLMMFPAPNECAPGSVFVEPALGNRGQIATALGTAPPTLGNWTPMAQTLEAAAFEPSLTDPTARPHVVLITDGWQWCSPYDPSTRFDPVNAIGNLNAAGITTYVVGFGASVDALALNQMAVEAGTARAGCDPSGDTPDAANPCYFQADSPAELLAALNDVAVDVSAEQCDGLDNDCDGLVDEDLVQECASACGTGTEMCVDGAWTGCDAAPVETEVCDGLDNDCDGTIDPGCECAAGETRACGGDETTGACTPGEQLCDANGTWGDCLGEVGPGSESCDGADNDCDGRVDESEDDVGNLCGPGLMCEAGVCEELDPVIPPQDEDEGFPADGGAAQAGCACDAGGGSGRNISGALLLAILVGAGLRRRRENT